MSPHINDVVPTANSNFGSQPPVRCPLSAPRCPLPLEPSAYASMAVSCRMIDACFACRALLSNFVVPAVVYQSLSLSSAPLVSRTSHAGGGKAIDTQVQLEAGSICVSADAADVLQLVATSVVVA